MKKKHRRAVSLGIVTLLILSGAWLWRSKLSGLFGWQSAVQTEIAAENTAATVGPFQIAATFQPDPPRVGKNTLSLAILDTDGAAVEGLTIDATANMPAMGAMPEMRSQGQVIAQLTSISATALSTTSSAPPPLASCLPPDSAN